MWIDIQVGPWVMVLGWGLLFILLSAVVYGLARTAESIARDRGKPRESGGTWGIGNTVGAVYLALVMLAVTLIPARALVDWLWKALEK